MVDVAQQPVPAAARPTAPSPTPAPRLPALPAAGWYADPLDGALRRWWDGSVWTDHTRVAIPGAAQPYAVVPAAGRPDVRSGLRDLAEAAPARSGATARVQWFEMPESNPTATTAFVLGIAAIVLNPAGIMSVLAVVLGVIGVAKSAHAHQAIGRRRAGWAIVLGILGGVLWGAATGWVLQHPEVLAPLGVHLS